MGDENNLNTYKLQLEQVEAALTTDPGNEELMQLRDDLTQVIQLTSQLIATGGGGSHNQQEEEHEQEEDEEEPELEPEPTKSVPPPEREDKKKSRWSQKEQAMPVKHWQVGERCQAIYRGDYYNSKIMEIDGDKVSVKFDGYDTLEPASLAELKLPVDGATNPYVKTSKRELEIKRKEYLKEKKKKKQERLKEQIEMKEKEKKQWQSFSSKAFGKKGFVKKSIFKTPESAEGKVGVGTCGMSGQGMTDYNPNTKYRKTF